ncbi:MAG: hypothetical protein ACQESH_01245 [Campylobacterota bacterium]
MAFEVSTQEGKLTIDISSNILNYAKVENIRDVIKQSVAKEVVLNFTNEMAVLPSSLIGTLLKLIHVDNKSITINTTNEDFIEMLKAFQLDTIITVNKI